MTRPLGAGELSLGSELKTEARKRRPEDNYYYSTSKLMNSGVTSQRVPKTIWLVKKMSS